MTVRRPDGSFIFHFANVVDDIEMGLSHVIRGEDHLMNTPKHLQLFEAFEVEPPDFAHIPLILNQDGSKMKKRDKGAAVRDYQQQGFLPDAVVNFLALLDGLPRMTAKSSRFPSWSTVSHSRPLIAPLPS